jgi:hypothetical protein
MNRKAPLFALATLLAAGPLTLFACLDDFSVGAALPDGGGGGGGDGMVAPDGGPGAEGSTDAGTDAADAADLTCVSAAGKFLASAAFPFNGTNHSLVGTSNGGYVFVGDFRGNVTYGDAGIIMGNTTTMDGAVVRFNPDGSLLWQAHFGGTGSDTFQGVTVDAQDDVYVTGYFSSTTFTIGTAFNNPTGANLGIVAKLDGKTGAPLWAHSFLPGYFGYGCSAIDFDSGRLVASCSMGTTQVHDTGAGTTAVLQGTQPAGAAVYGLDPMTGYVLWGKGLGAVTSDMNAATEVHSVDVTANGVVVAGVFSGGSLTERQTNAITVAQVGTKQNGFVTELSASNPALPLWAKGFGDSSSVGQVQSVSAAGTSLTGIVAGGSFTGTVNFGAASHASVGSSDAFVMMLRNKAGAPDWEKYFGGMLGENINRVRFDNCGRPEALLFAQSGLAMTDGVTIPAPQANGVASIVAKMEPKDGKLLWASGITPGGNVDLNGINGYDLAVDTKGVSFVVGDFRGAVDLGSGTPSVANGGSHPYLVGYGP